MKKLTLTARKEIATLCFSTLVFFVSLPAAGQCGSTQSKVESTIKKVENSVSRDKIKSKFHEAADNLDKDKVNETVDRVADYLDKDKLKEQVDVIADYFDKEKIKDLIDLAAEYLDRDKIKNVIDLIADSLDREQVKEYVDQIASKIDKEQIKEKFDESVDQIADSLQKATRSFENEIRSLGQNQGAIQNVLKKYNWNQWISDSVVSGPVTLSNLKLGKSKKVIIVRPGEKIEGEVLCTLNRDECSALSLYRVVLGIKDQGGQTTICNHFGLRAGRELDHFSLIAPRQKGVYQVGFRVVKAALETKAIDSWGDHSDSPEGQPAVIGLIIVT